MNTNYLNVTQDIMLAEMTRKQSNQFLLNYEAYEWMILKNISFECGIFDERSSMNSSIMHRGRVGERIRTLLRQIRIATATGLRSLADKLDSVEKKELMQHA